MASASMPDPLTTPAMCHPKKSGMTYQSERCDRVLHVAMREEVRISNAATNALDNGVPAGARRRQHGT
jgi:hypothetical protein